MDFKKLAVGAVGAAALLAVVTPAFAGERHHRYTRPQDELEIEVEDTHVNAMTLTVANSGFNYAGGSESHHGRGHHGNNGGDVTTGGALASATVVQDVNYVKVDGCGCFDDVKVEVEDTHVNAMTLTVANSGFNRARGGDVDSGRAQAGSSVTQLVNTVVVGSEL